MIKDPLNLKKKAIKKNAFFFAQHENSENFEIFKFFILLTVLLSSGFLSVGKKSYHVKTVGGTVPIFGEPSDDVTGQLSWDTRLRGALALIYEARKPPKGTKFPTRPSWKKKFFRITPFLTKSLKNIKKWALQSFRSVTLTEPSQNCHFLKKKNQNFFFSELPNFWQKCQKTLKSKPRKISDQSH